MKGLKTLLLTMIIAICCLTSCKGDPRQLKGVSEEDLGFINAAEAFIMDESTIDVNRVTIKQAIDSNKSITRVRYVVDRLNNGNIRVNFMVNVDPKLFAPAKGEDKNTFINDYLQQYAESPINNIEKPVVKEFALLWSIYLTPKGEKAWSGVNSNFDNRMLCTQSAVVVEDKDGNKTQVIGIVPSGGMILANGVTYGEAEAAYAVEYENFMSIWH